MELDTVAAVSLVSEKTVHATEQPSTTNYLTQVAELSKQEVSSSRVLHHKSQSTEQ